MQRGSRFARSLVIGVAAMALVAGVAVADDELEWWGSYYSPGNITVGATVGAAFSGGLSLWAYPRAEMVFYTLGPVDFGAGVQGVVGTYTGTSTATGYFGFGAGPYVSAHLGFRGLLCRFGVPGAEYLERFDLFSALGLGYQVYTAGGPSSGLSFFNFSGFNYFLTDNLALSLTSTYYGSTFGGTFGGSIGALLRIGPKPELAPCEPVVTAATIRSLEADMVYLSFGAVYWSMLAYTGFLADDLNYQVGDETTFRVTYQDGRDRESYEYTRALLHRNADGTAWWRLSVDWTDFDDADMPTEYEFLVNAQHDVLRLRYTDTRTGQLVTHVPRDQSAWRGPVYQRVEDPSVAATRVRTEQTRVPAGTFQTTVYRSQESGADITWWISDQVPGTLVKIDGTTVEGDQIQGELQNIRRNVRSPWEPAW